jgi:hypothetical protein
LLLILLTLQHHNPWETQGTISILQPRLFVYLGEKNACRTFSCTGIFVSDYQ